MNRGDPFCVAKINRLYKETRTNNLLFDNKLLVVYNNFVNLLFYGN